MAANSHSIDLEASSSQYLSISDASQTGLDITGDISIAAWINIESTGVHYAIVSKWISAGNVRSYDFSKIDTGKLEFFFSADGTVNYTQVTTDSAQISSTATWYHVAVTADVSVPTVTFYVNGSTVASTASSTLSTSIYNSTTAFEVGRREGGSNHFDGLMDEVIVTSDVLTSGEITKLYNGQTPTTAGLDNVQGYWSLNNALTDGSGNGNTLTNNGSAVFSTTVPFADYTTVAQTSTSYSFFM